MKFDHIRDYASDAFRFYYQSGGVEKYINNKLCDMDKGGAGVSNPTEAALIHRERVYDEKHAEIEDLIAVDNVIKILDANGHTKAKTAVETVYCAECKERGEIKIKVSEVCEKVGATERDIYRALKMARDLFAVERKLRL
jgi:hypothetical protein